MGRDPTLVGFTNDAGGKSSKDTIGATIMKYSTAKGKHLDPPEPAGAVPPAPGSSRKLTPQEWDLIQDRLNQFEKACQGGTVVDLGPFLPPPNDPLHLWALREMIRADLAIRWRHARPIALEEYQRRFPELDELRWFFPELLYAEYRARHHYGDKPDLAGFRARFPEAFPELERLVQERLPAVASKPTPVPTPASFQAPATIAPPEAGKEAVVAVAGGYRLIKRIGSGSFGEVWRAEAPGGIDVAVKIIMGPINQAEAQRELEALEVVKRLRHPFLLQLHAFWAQEDRLLIAMELADGSLSDLADKCRRDGLPGIPLNQLLTYTREAAGALDYLHGKQVVHRDIKPANILLLEGHAKLADLGLARMMERRSLAATTSGTPAYMAPEVWHGRASIQSDQYSLAATYVELRRGTPLFEAPGLMQVMFLHLEQPPDLSPLGPDEQAVLRRALAKKAEDRYPSCTDFWRALLKAVGPELNGLPGGSLHGDNPPAPTPVVPPITRRRLLTAALVLFGLAPLGGVAAWYIIQTRPYLPPDCQPDDGTDIIRVDGQKFYARIAHVRPNRPRVVFCFVRQMKDTDPPSFYMMQNKVSNQLFRAFAQANPEKVAHSQWEKGANVLNKDGKFQDLGNADDQLPVFRVTVDEAQAFAKWLGGDLPTALQWDKAAGKLDAYQGPFLRDPPPQGPDDVAVDREAMGPKEVGTSPADESWCHCRDMAGNGREWTRWDVNRQELPFPAAGSGKMVLVRGQSYTADEPLQFRKNSSTDVVKPAEAWPDISFRVVIEIPISS